MIHEGKRDLRRWLAVLAGLLLTLVCVHQLTGESGYFRTRERNREVEKVGDEVRRLAEENRALEQSIRKLQSDPQAIERIAREEMKLARPGEVIYTLPAPPAPPAPQHSAQKSR